MPKPVNPHHSWLKYAPRPSLSFFCRSRIIATLMSFSSRSTLKPLSKNRHLQGPMYSFSLNGRFLGIDETPVHNQDVSLDIAMREFAGRADQYMPLFQKRYREMKELGGRSFRKGRTRINSAILGTATPETFGSTAKPAIAKTGRNEACPCGSGRKFKVCCLRSANAQL